MATGLGDLKIFSGSAHPQLTKEIADFLGIPLGQARLRRFPDTEILIHVDPEGQTDRETLLPQALTEQA